jgi:hypothetical protein
MDNPLDSYYNDDSSWFVGLLQETQTMKTDRKPD